jgi:hypothetical protein
MEEYDEGKPVADITKDILEDCLEEFEETDGTLHDVYFALGKAEWMCGGISHGIYTRIRQIIDNGENLVYLQELDATESDLKLRKKNLDKFLHSLSSPREKARKRKTPESKYVPQEKPKYPALPKIQAGDIFAYRHKQAYRMFAIVRRTKLYGRPAAYAYAWRKEFQDIPDPADLEQEYLIPLGYFLGDTFPDARDYVFVANVPEIKKLGTIYYPGVIHPSWKPATFALAKPENLVEAYPISLCLTLRQCYQKIEERKQRHSAQ